MRHPDERLTEPVPDFPQALRHALVLLTRHPVLDTHNDLPFALRERAGGDAEAAAAAVVQVSATLDDTQTDLPRLRLGRVGGQFWSAYVPASWDGGRAVRATFEQVDLIHRMVSALPAELAWCTTADDVEAALREGRIASLVGIEGGHCIGGSLDTLRELYARGGRYLTLTHNDTTDWADSATDEARHGGLTDEGRAVVGELNRLGMLVDLSHVAPTTMRDALETSRAPVIFSHSSCRAVTDHPRNVPDDVLERLRDNGGVLCVTFVPSFVSAACAAWDARLRAERDRRGLPRDDWAAMAVLADEMAVHSPRPTATVADVADHLDHARAVVGPEGIGLGGDYDGTAEQPLGLEDVTGYPLLFAELVRRGWSDDDLVRLASGNVLRVLRAVERP